MAKNIITIGREYGSGGYEIGQKIAGEMGYTFYDKGKGTDQKGIHEQKEG